MSHSQFHCTGRAYLDMHGLIFETSICYWQDQPGKERERSRDAAGGGRERERESEREGGREGRGAGERRAPGERSGRCTGGRRGRTGTSGTREREARAAGNPPERGVRHPSARAQRHPVARESTATAAPVPRPTRRFLPRHHRHHGKPLFPLPPFPAPPPPPLLPRRGIGKSRDAPAVPGAGRAGGRALREAEREATGDGRPAGTTEPPQSGKRGAGRTGGGRRGQNREGHPSEPGDTPVPRRREDDTLPTRGPRRGPYRARPRRRMRPGLTGGRGPQRAHPQSTRASEAQRRGDGETTPDPLGRGRRTVNRREGDHANGERRETGRRPTPGEKRRMRTGPTPDTRRRRPRADRWRRRGGGRRATLTPRGGREGGRARVGREAGPRGSEGERHRPEPPPPHRDAHTGSTQRPGAHLGTPAAFPRRTPSQRTAGPDGPPRRRTLSQQAPRTGVGDSH